MEKYYDDDSARVENNMESEHMGGGEGLGATVRDSIESKTMDGAPLGKSWLTEQNITMGLAGRTLTIAEIMGALNEVLSSDKIKKVEISPLQKPVLWDGSPLTGGTLADRDLVSAYNINRDFSRRMQTNSVDRFFSTTSSTSLYIQRSAFKDRHNDDCSYLFCDKYSLILLGPEARDTKDVILIEPNKLKSNNIYVKFPYNFAFLIHVTRPDLFEIYRDKFSFTDREGYEIELRNALNNSSKNLSLPGVSGSKNVKAAKTNALHSANMQDIKTRLVALQSERTIEERADELFKSIVEAGLDGLVIIDNFGGELERIASDAALYNSKALLQSGVDISILEDDLQKLSNLEPPKLKRQPWLSRIGWQDPVMMRPEDFRTQQLGIVTRVQQTSQLFANASRDRRRELLGYEGMMKDLAQLLTEQAKILSIVRAKEEIASNPRLVRTIDSRMEALSARSQIMQLSEEFLTRFVDDMGERIDMLTKVEMGAQMVGLIFQEDVLADQSRRQLTAANTFAEVSSPVFTAAREKREALLADLRTRREAEDVLRSDLTTNIVLKI